MSTPKNTKISNDQFAHVASWLGLSTEEANGEAAIRQIVTNYSLRLGNGETEEELRQEIILLLSNPVGQQAIGMAKDALASGELLAETAAVQAASLLPHAMRMKFNATLLQEFQNNNARQSGQEDQLALGKLQIVKELKGEKPLQLPQGSTENK